MESWIEKTKSRKPKGLAVEDARPYLDEYYNVHFYQNLASCGDKSSFLARISNALNDAVNERQRLPRHLIVIIDVDLMADFNLADENLIPEKEFKKAITWLTKDLDLTIKCRRRYLTDKKPGAIYGEHPKIIYVKTLRRSIYYPPSSKMGRICSVRTKFNEALNNAVGEAGHNLMNINACEKPEHFDSFGYLTETGKSTFWHQLDELIEHFDMNKIMLLPAGKPHFNKGSGDKSQQSNTSENKRYVLPKPSQF